MNDVTLTAVLCSENCDPKKFDMTSVTVVVTYSSSLLFACWRSCVALATCQRHNSHTHQCLISNTHPDRRRLIVTCERRQCFISNTHPDRRRLMITCERRRLKNISEMCFYTKRRNGSYRIQRETQLSIPHLLHNGCLMTPLTVERINADKQSRFLPRDAMLAQYILCPASVHLSVCLSQAGIEPKLLNKGSRIQRHTKTRYDILTPKIFEKCEWNHPIAGTEHVYRQATSSASLKLPSIVSKKAK